MVADPTGRPPSKFPCVYWNGTVCTASSIFATSDISCFNGGACDGFGTCRGCTKYDQGGLKLDDVDGQGGFSQTPINLQVYNIRAKIRPCCNWDGPIVEFGKRFVRTDTSVDFASIQSDILNVFGSDLNGFPSSGELVGIRSGQDDDGNLYPKVNIKYKSKGIDSFQGVTLSPINVLKVGYTLYLAERKVVPRFLPEGRTVDVDKGETTTFCKLPEAAPWQEGFTEENPTAYGCNGAKAECPFYTGPKFTEVVDVKMDKGDRYTARQLMELRYYSQDWPSVASDSFQSPRELWESLFHKPDIWAWTRDLSETARTPGRGRKDPITGKPLIEKVTITDFSGDTPGVEIGRPVLPEDGTIVVDGPPAFPTKVLTSFDIVSGIKIVFPRGTNASNPFIKRSFTPDERFFYISFLANTDREVVAVNLTKHPQENMSDEDFIDQIKLIDPEGISKPFDSPLPGKTVSVELEYGGSVNKLNHIRIYVDTGLGELDKIDSLPAPGSFDPDNEIPSLPNGQRKYLKADVYVEHRFYHAHIMQTYFNDYYGHKVVDPWINHFTRMDLGGEILNLTQNLRLGNVLWNSISSDGRKTIYAVEIQKEISTQSNQVDLRWQLLECNYVLVEFLDKNINRVNPWKAWGLDSREQDLYVVLNRSANSDISSDEPREVEFELVFASTKGTILPANMAIFRPKDGLSVRPPDPSKDFLDVRYAYTDYRQGPIEQEDVLALKYPSDADDIITAYPYGVEVEDNKFKVDGCFIRTTSKKFYSCDEVVGDCFSEKAATNEELARQSFAGGGVNDDAIRRHIDLVNDCAEIFSSENDGEFFEDGVPVTYNEVARRLNRLYYKEGSLHFSFLFEDEEGRRIGVKNVGFLAQSAMIQTRDVEIRYKWGAQSQHYPNNNGFFMFASFYAPLYSTTNRLIYLIQPYDPVCGDHAGTEGFTQYRAFDLAVDRHGPLWYPYNRCETPRYHADSSFFTNVVHYQDVVEGFTDDKRRDYWERMRVWDKFMPAVMNKIFQIGCIWSEKTTTINTNPPYVFLGYTKIRSSHPFGPFSSDRESLRVSRHWEKRNLSVDEEIIKQDEDGISIDLSPELKSKMFDANGDLREGAELEAPIWVHINDEISFVKPATEELEHPFTHLLLQRVGSHSFQETYSLESANRFDLRDVMEERDYTTTLDRSPDGSQIYLADGTQVNVSDGISLLFDYGRDVRWVYRKDAQIGALGSGSVGWCWVASPPPPSRNGQLIGGLYLKNPRSLFFKQNLSAATHTTEGTHSITYVPHQFDGNGNVQVQARISMDGGPHYEIDLDTGNIVMPDGSPYDSAQHEGQDYTFVMHGLGPNGIGILADNRGLQRYESDGVKYATLAGININPNIDINELPYEAKDFLVVNRLSNQHKKVTSLVKEHLPTSNGTVTTGLIDFVGHYFIERVDFEFGLGGNFDIPSLTAEGRVFNSEQEGNTVLFNPTSYISGQRFDVGQIEVVSIPIGVRLETIKISFGARLTNRSMLLRKVSIVMRDPISFSENDIYVYTSRANISVSQNGTHHPAELEFYFQRSYPDFAKNYLSGQIAIGGDTAFFNVAGVEVKYTGRRIKDVIPHFEFSDAINVRFPYGNIDITEIPGYVEQTTSLGQLKYINNEIRACSKGWTMATSAHSDDPAGDLSHPNAFDGVRPFEEIQETLYQEAATLLGDKLAVYTGFFHPAEVEFFNQAGIDLSNTTWSLVLNSTVAPINKVFRHEDFGCSAEATNEYFDGIVHKLENWQARGVFHYQCDPRFNYGCFSVLMNKCESYLFREYGTAQYLNNDVLGRFNYVFAIPPKDGQSYIAAGLIDRNYFSGVWGGFSPTTAAQAAHSALPFFYEWELIYDPLIQKPRGPGPYQ